MFSVKFHSLCDATCIMQHGNAVITLVYLHFYCDFQQNIALFCAISDFVLLLLFADALCLIQWRYRKNVFFQGGATGREVTVEIVVEVYPIPQPSRGFGERRKSGEEPQPKTVFGRFMRNFVPF